VARSLQTLSLFAMIILIAVALVALYCPEVVCADCPDEIVVAKQTTPATQPVVPGLVASARTPLSCEGLSSRVFPTTVVPLDVSALCSRLLI